MRTTNSKLESHRKFKKYQTLRLYGWTYRVSIVVFERLIEKILCLKTDNPKAPGQTVAYGSIYDTELIITGYERVPRIKILRQETPFLIDIRCF